MGLKLVNIFSSRLIPLDILTMLGFVILIGVVVSNAILIVHQDLNNIREQGMGLGSVVLGGLALSTVFTIFVIPALLLFFIQMEKRES